MASEGDHGAYRLSAAETPQAEEAIQLMKLLYEEFERLVPTDLPAAEREARIARLLEQDSRLRKMALRMDALFRGA